MGLSEKRRLTFECGEQSIYNDKARFLYDYWGPAQAEMSLAETQCNTALFYVLWSTIMCVRLSDTHSVRTN